ncbi:MAG: mechanosensitive ion channel [Bacteroidales bacterium]|nr:mechanosensitive ion channel [Bacteroidales bacterium]
MKERITQLFDQWTGTTTSTWIIAASVILFSLLVYYVFSRVLSRIWKKSPDHLIKIVWHKFRNPVLVVILLFDFIILKELFSSGEKASSGINQFITVAIIFCITWILIRSINLARELVLRQYDITQEDNLRARRIFTQFRILERIIIFIVILISIAIALMTFEGIRRIGISLFASAGVAGIILGFAAQKLLSSIMAGFQIALAQPIRIDDVVIVENEWGWIEEITLTYVVVRIWDKRRLIVPTTYFIEKPFQNWTRASSDILGTVFIYTDYQVPVDRLRTELTRILENSDLWDGQTNVMQVTNATDRSVEIRALMSAANSPTAWDLRVLVREKLITFLQKNYPGSLPRTRIEMTSRPADNFPPGD